MFLYADRRIILSGKPKMIKNKIFTNASWLIGCRIVQSVFSLLITMLTARILGPADYGVINYAASLVSFLVPVMQLGLNSILVLELIKEPKKEGEILGSSLFMSFLSALLSILGVTAFAFAANGGNREITLICALYSLLLITQSFELIQYWFQAKYLSKYTAVATLCASIAVSLYKFFILLTTENLYLFALSHAIDYLIISAALIIIYRKKGGQRLSISFPRIRSLWKGGRYYIISGLMVTVFAQTDKIMLKHMTGDAETGYYSAAFLCAGVTSFVFAAIIDSARPSIFESLAKSEADFETGMTRLYSVVIYLSLLQSLCMTLLSGFIINLLYGSAYAPAADALKLIVWYTTFSYMGAVRNIWIVAMEKQKYLWIINLSGALTNIALNFFLIPIWGIMGASLASLVTQMFTNVIIGFIIRPIIKNNALLFRGFDPRNILALIKKTR